MELLGRITPKKNLALALGYFDGIHTGHREIIKNLIEYAKNYNLKTALITFNKNPANYFNSKPVKNLQTSEQREEILSSLGLDYLYELDFKDFKDLSAKEYLENILIKNFKPKVIIAGYNHTFGKDRLGTPSFLEEKSKEYNYQCIIVPEKKHGNKSISSTIIRKKIESGDIKSANELLGRNFSIKNIVEHGDNIAHNLGFATANLIWQNHLTKLPYGVYFGYAKIDSKSIPALISWGTKPTLSNEKKEVLEAHIYNFNQDIYNKNIEIFFSEKLREQKKFNSIDCLKQQLQKDHEAFKIWLDNRHIS